MRKIKEFKSYVSLLLILTILFTSNSDLMAYEEDNVIDVGGLQTSNIDDESLGNYDSYDNESTEDFKINIDWADSKFKNGSELKILEESDTSNSVKLRVNYGNQKVNEKGYKPGELIITVKGIGAINRSGAIEASVGADKVGSGTQNRDWSYTWNKSNDMYTFTNNNEIKANSVVSGYFDMIWNIKARDSIHGYSQNDIQANMILLDGSNIESNILSIENNTKCDKYSIDIERELLYSGNGVSGELDVDDYTFIKYSLTSYINKSSRGVSGEERFIFDPDTDDRSKECLITYSTNGFREENDNTYRILLSNNKAVGTQYIVVAYPKDVYAEKEINASISSYGTFFEGDDAGVKEEVHLAYDDIKFITPSEFDFASTDGNMGIIKTSSYENKIYTDNNFKNSFTKNGGHLSGIKMYSGDIQSFLAGVSKDTYGDNGRVTLELVDDFMYITQNNNNYRELNYKDYNIESIDILPTSGIKNENNLSIESDKYTVQVYAVQNGSTYERNDDTLVWEGFWKDYEQNIKLPDNTTAVGAVFNNIDEALNINWDNNKDLCNQPMIQVNVNYHINDEGLADDEKSNLTNGQVVNLISVRQYDEDGNIIETDIEEDYYLDGNINIDLAQKDLDTYGKYQSREKGAIIFYGAEKSDYKSTTDISAITQNGNKYKARVTMGAEFDFTEDERPTKFSLYTVLPENVVINSYDIIEDIWELIDFSGLGLDSDTIANHCNIEVIENYRDSGRVYLALHFDFSDIELDQKSKIKASFEIKINKEYFKNSKNSVDVRSLIMLDADVNSYDIGKALDDGKWNRNDNISNDIDNDSNEQEFLAYSYDNSTYTYVDSSELQIYKSVKTSSISDYVQLPYVPSAEQNSEYFYELTLKNGNGTLRDVNVIDILENGTNSDWKGTFKEVVVTSSDKLDYKVYYSDSIDNPNWVESLDNKEVKSVMIDFEDSELYAGSEIVIYIKMTAPEDNTLKNKVTENNFQTTFTMKDSTTGNDTKYDSLVSNFVQVKLTATLKNIIVTKKDEISGDSVSGAVYQLLNKDTGEILATGVTNSKGQIIFKNVSSDEVYLIREEEAPYGYENGEDIEIVFSDGKTTKVNVKEKRKTGSIELNKTNSLDNLLKVADAEYTLYKSDGTEVSKVRSDINGKIKFDNLDWGDYYIKETEAPNGYKLDTEKYEFSITRENVHEVKKINIKEEQSTPVKIQLTKLVKTTTGVQTNEVLPGAVFQLIRTTGGQENLIGNYVTDKNGEIVIEDIAYGDYEFREIKVPIGYIKEDNIEFSVTPDNSKQSLIVYNQRRTGSIHIYKKDNLNNIVDGAVFELYDKTKDNVLGTYTTDRTGSFIIRNLEWGKYYLREKSTPDCYQLNQDWIEVDINSKKLNQNLTIVNETKKGIITLVKTDEIGKNLLSGAEFNLYSEDGTLLKEGLVTDGQGELRIENLEWGKYYFKETKAPNGYGLTDETIRFSVNSINAGLEQSIYVVNPLDSKTITLTKKIKASEINFDNGDPTFLFKVSGVDVNGNEHTYYRILKFDSNYIASNTDEFGYVYQSVTVSGLVAGKYTVSEEDSSRYYLDSISDGSSNVDINGDTAVINLIDEDNGSVTFNNVRYEYADYSDNDAIANSIKESVKYTTLKVNWLGDKEVKARAEIDNNLIEVQAIYDDGTAKSISNTDWSFGESFSGIKFPNINGDYRIPITYSEGGITRTAYFEISIYGAVKEVVDIEASINEEYESLLPGQELSNDMLSISAIYNDNSQELLTDESVFRLSRTHAPYAGGLFEVEVTLNQDKFEEDVTDISTSLYMNVEYLEPLLTKGSTFKNKIPGAATSVVFTDEIAPESAELTDLSDKGNWAVVGWLDGDVWKVSTQRKGVKAIGNKDCSYMFNGKSALTDIDFTFFDTSNVTFMKDMFWNCSNLTSSDVSNFNTSNVINMSGMFNTCSKLTELDVSNFDTTNVTNMSGMFTKCNNLLELDVSNFDTTNVTNMSGMFTRCNNLLELDVSNFNTENVTNMNGIFSYCNSLTSLDVSNFDTSKVTNMFDMFAYCKSLTYLDVSNFDTSKVTDMRYMFQNCNSLTSLDVSNFDTSNVANMGSMFVGCSRLTELDVSNFDTSNVTNMGSMFSSCSSLTELDVSNFDTTKVTGMASMFQSCSSLTELDVSNFNTANVTNMSSMFNGCKNIASLDIANWNTQNITNMNSIFNNCDHVKEIDLSNWDTSNVTTTDAMFYHCDSLEKITFGDKFDTSKITNMNCMFFHCGKLKQVDISTFNMQSVKSLAQMFAFCSTLEYIGDLTIINQWDMTDKNIGAAFNGCYKLITLPSWY